MSSQGSAGVIAPQSRRASQASPVQPGSQSQPSKTSPVLRQVPLPLQGSTSHGPITAAHVGSVPLHPSRVHVRAASPSSSNPSLQAYPATAPNVVPPDRSTDRGASTAPGSPQSKRVSQASPLYPSSQVQTMAPVVSSQVPFSPQVVSSHVGAMGLQVGTSPSQPAAPQGRSAVPTSSYPSAHA